MEFLLAIEPLTALVVAAGVVIIAPLVSVLGKDSNLVESVSQSARDFTKNALAVGMEATENAQTAIAQAQESFQDIVAEAKAEQLAKKSAENAEKVEPHEVTIVSE